MDRATPSVRLNFWKGYANSSCLLVSHKKNRLHFVCVCLLYFPCNAAQFMSTLFSAATKQSYLRALHMQSSACRHALVANCFHREEPARCEWQRPTWVDPNFFSAWLEPPPPSRPHHQECSKMLSEYTNAVEIIFLGGDTWSNLTASEHMRNKRAGSARNCHLKCENYQSGIQHTTFFFLLMALGRAEGGEGGSSKGDCNCPTTSALDQQHCPWGWCSVTDKKEKKKERKKGQNSKLLFSLCDTVKI